MKKTFLTTSLLALFAVAAAGPAADAPTFTPFYAKYFLVAGSGEPALKDGHFMQAAFKQPNSLVLSQDGGTLYVADFGNHAIRAVALRQQHQVSTLCGNGEAGAVDGGQGAARLTGPQQPQLSADGSRLYFLDQGGAALRELDLATHSVSTVLRLPAPLSFTSVAVDGAGKGLYLARQGHLMAWDGKAPHPSTLLEDAALACASGRLVLAGRRLYYVSPCDHHIYLVKDARGPFPEALDQRPNAKPALSLQPLADLVVGASASGFCPMDMGEGGWSILAWDPGLGTFVAYGTGGGVAMAYAMNDYQGTPLLGPTADLVGINGNSDRRLLLKGPVGLAVGPEGMIYAAEAVSGRIVGADRQLFIDAGTDINVIRAGETKPVGVKRLLLVGDSLAYFWRDYTPDKRFNVSLSFARQLELDLNLESALAGQGGRYEVEALTEQLGNMSGGTTSLYLTRADRVKGRGIDEVLIVVDYMSFTKELLMFANNQTDDDLATLGFQLDWQGMKGAERYKLYGPLRRGLVDDIRSHPLDYKGYADFDDKGNLRFLGDSRELYKLPRIQQFARDLLQKALLKCQARAAKDGATLSVVLLPTRDLVEMGEGGGDDFYEHLNADSLDAPILAAAHALKIPSYCLTPVMRLVALPFYPLIGKADHHYNHRGQGWLASMLARQMTGSLAVGVDGR